MENWKKTFLIIWSGQVFSLITTALVQFSIIFWITKETGSATVLSFAAIAATLPNIIFGPFIGVWVDRYSRKMIMVLSDYFIALFSLVAAVLFYYNVIEVWHIYVLLILRSAGSAFYMPAMQAVTPLLAPEEQLMRVNSVNQSLFSAANIAGPALGAVLISFFSMQIIMLSDVLGAVIASSTLLFVHIPEIAKKQNVKPNVMIELKEGINAILENRGIAWMICIWMLCVFVYMPINTLFPLMTYNHFKGGAIEMGIIEIAGAAGMLVGAVIMGYFKFENKKVTMINLGYVIMGITLFSSGLLPANAFIFFASFCFVFGISIPFFYTPMMSIIQATIAPEVLGRVFSLFHTIVMAPSLVGLLATGLIAEVIGVTMAFSISGFLIILFGMGSFFIPALMKLEISKP
ncbi:MAG TPA: MFS transporter [Ignavibacteriaceae bacterium]|nr:MFS transporter [Ignavibacteriaceae bacterium]